MANTRRLERINSLMKRIISEEVVFRLRDPRIGFVTITRVSCTPDLSEAKVYFSVLGDEEEIRTTTRGLRSASGPIRSVVAKEMQVRSVPRLEFVFDPSLREQAEIDQILKQDRLKHGRAEKEEEEEGEEAEKALATKGHKGHKVKEEEEEEKEEEEEEEEEDEEEEEEEEEEVETDEGSDADEDADAE